MTDDEITIARQLVEHVGNEIIRALPEPLRFVLLVYERTDDAGRLLSVVGNGDQAESMQIPAAWSLTGGDQPS